MVGVKNSKEAKRLIQEEIFFFFLCYRYNLLNVMKTLGGFIRALLKVTNTRLNTRVERTAI